MKRSYIKQIAEREESHLKDPENIFNKIIKEKVSNLKKDMPLKVQKQIETK